MFDTGTGNGPSPIAPPQEAIGDNRKVGAVPNLKSRDANEQVVPETAQSQRSAPVSTKKRIANINALRRQAAHPRIPSP